MHEWHTNTSTNILSLINQFLGFQYETDYSGQEEVKRVKISNRTFPDVDSARTYVTDASYSDSNTAYLAAVIPGKTSKAYQNTYANFLAKYKDYTDFERNLTIAYGRKASKVTCPHCGSSINLKYGARFKECPVCGSSKIISDSNWKTLDTKKKMCEKASAVLAQAAVKDKITFICGIEWHC